MHQLHDDDVDSGDTTMPILVIHKKTIDAAV
jgi:hypothetical protein